MTTSGSGPTRARHSAATSASAGSALDVVTSTLRSASDAGTPPTAGGAGVEHQRGEVAGAVGECRKVRVNQAEPADRASTGTRIVLDPAREPRSRLGRETHAGRGCVARDNGAFAGSRSASSTASARATVVVPQPRARPKTATTGRA